MSKTKIWIEAMRPRTLPASTAGVVTGIALCELYGCLKWAPAILCLLFALLAQISSNFANEYFDYRDGLDRPGREGPRRGVTEGDISPRAMLMATFASIGAACAVGCTLIIWGGWQLIPAGVFIAAGVFAYSAGPYPLSRHALGEVAVILFYGIVPVTMIFYIMSHTFDLTVFIVSVAVGLMGANILIVNNYRDTEDDRAVGKTTISTKFGTTFASALYLFNGWIAMALTAPVFLSMPAVAWTAPAVYLTAHTWLWTAMLRRTGRQLNPLLGMTAVNELVFALIFTLIAFLI